MDYHELHPENKIDIKKITIKGNHRTRPDILIDQLNEAAINSNLHSSAIIPINDNPYRAKIPVKNLQHSDQKQTYQVGELYYKLNIFTKKIKTMDLFDSVDACIEIENPPRNGKYEGNVIITVKEKGPYYISMKADAGTSQMNLQSGVEVSGGLRNPLGFGEQIKISNSLNDTGGRKSSLSLSIPKVLGGVIDLEVKSNEINQSILNPSSSSFSQDVKSFTLEYKPKNNKYGLSLEYSIRDEKPIFTSIETQDKSKISENNQQIKTISTTFLNQAISSVKTSLSLVYPFIDTRDDRLNPSNGQYFTSTTELAIPPGQSQFLKQDFHAQWHYSFPSLEGLVFSCVGNFGVMYPLSLLFPMISTQDKDYQKSSSSISSSSFTSYLSDRYQLGGPFSLRGFQNLGVGPRSVVSNPSNPLDLKTSTSLGGDTRTSLLALLSLPVNIIPNLDPSFATRAFFFVNLGSIGNSNYWKSQAATWSSYSNLNTISQNLNTLYEGKTIEVKSKYQPLFSGYFRASIGSGISVSLMDNFRFELTYSLPILKAKHDLCSGFQLGVGITMN